MRNRITAKELIEKRFSAEEAKQIMEDAENEIIEIKWGGRRKNAGRKPKLGVTLKFQIRVSEKEKEFIKYARSHNLNYDDLMKE